MATFGAPTTGFSTPSGYSTKSTAFGADQAPEVGVGGIQSLKDLGDYTKMSNPAGTAGLTGDLSTVTQKLSDMGASKLVNADAAKAMFGSIQSVPSPLNAAANPTLKSLIDEVTPNIKSMIGSGTGKDGIPTINDFLGPVTGGGAFEKILSDGGPTAENVAALKAQINSTKSLFATAGIQKAANPATQTLGDAMNFAGSLHKWGKDQSEGGLGQSLRGMAKDTTKYGEALKVSLAEGNNKKILSANSIKPLVTTPPEPLPTATSTVEFPITISQRFERPAGGYRVVEVQASSAANVLWRLVNGEYTTNNAEVIPYQVLYSGSYDGLYAAAQKAASDQPGTTAPQVFNALPGMKVELDTKMKGASPVALG